MHKFKTIALETKCKWTEEWKEEGPQIDDEITWQMFNTADYSLLRIQAFAIDTKLRH